MLARIFASSHQKKSLGSQFRKKRFLHFKNWVTSLNLPQPIRILDIGGLSSYWENMDDVWVTTLNITLLNLTIPEKRNEKHFNYLAGDATNLLAIDDDSYDIVFSNSVIEHLHNYENQQKMAKEILRVGKHHYIQTPNKYFFLEPHYVLPFFQFLPKKNQLFILTKTPFSRMKRWEFYEAKNYVDEISLLSIAEMKSLFAHSSLYYERFFGLKKSIIAYF